MTDDKIRISPDALIAMVVTEAQDRELAKMPSIEEMNESFQPSEKFLQKMERLVRETQRKAERKHFFTQLKRFFHRHCHCFVYFFLYNAPSQSCAGGCHNNSYRMAR